VRLQQRPEILTQEINAIAGLGALPPPPLCLAPKSVAGRNDNPFPWRAAPVVKDYPCARAFLGACCPNVTAWTVWMG
jgi:hypothetical protein